MPNNPPSSRQEEANAASRGARPGELKVYLGMSAGVGKTYSMLSDALIAQQRGIDVVAGYIEPHGRVDTERLARDLEQIEPRRVNYRGLTLAEFDLDAALARHPHTILVDELAHHNAPGSRHEKRWQDVLELLGAGIHVWTTVNVQHLESLRDVVSRITGVEVQETVPDTVLARADEVELVDTPPDELLQRLGDGKIYPKERVSHAVSNFFKKGNLIALRELVLRHTAERVDAQLRRYRDLHQVREVWPTTERILVCVAPNALSPRVVREAGRLANSLHAQLIAVSIENLSYAELSAEQRSRATAALRVAENLGAETIVRSAEDVVGAILAIARERNVSAIVVGKSVRKGGRMPFRPAFVDDLMQRSGDISVHVIPGGEHARRARRATNQTRSFSAAKLTASLAVVLGCTALGLIMRPWFELSNIIMVYLLGTTAVAYRFTRQEAIFSAIASVLAFDFCFVPPQFTFAVTDAQYVVTFIIMLLVAVLISSLTLRLRAYAAVVLDRERRASALFDLTRVLASADDDGELARITTQHIRDLIGHEAAAFIPKEQELMVCAHSPSRFEEDANERAVAAWVWQKGESAGATTATLGGAKALYLPLKAGGVTLGVLAILVDGAEIVRSELDLCLALSDQLALALARARLKAESTRARVMAEQENIRNSLLSSVSHDLRTPLASIAGAASALVENPRIDEKTRTELAVGISEEARRLERILRNVLDVTRLESGEIRLQKEWQSIEEIVGSALARCAAVLGERRVSVSLPDIPLVKVDGMLLEQLFVNLIENAVKHSGSDGKIEISGSLQGPHVSVSVADHGVGIPPGDEEKIFKKMYRAPKALGHGFGLGLAICRAIATAHGGAIGAANRSEGGAVFTVALPIGEAPPEVPRG